MAEHPSESSPNDPTGPGEAAIREAADVLRRGGLVAFPTETVYGLGADAADPAAVRRIFEAKGRPADHPVIVHLPDVRHLAEWATVRSERAAWIANELAAAFWPGPLTLVLPRGPRAHDVVTGGQDTVGLRVPGHPVAQALLRAFGGAIAAPSANRFGRISPTRASHVRDELGDAVDVVLDGGPCDVGVESTIVDLSGRDPRLLRPGGVDAEAIERVLGRVLERDARAAPRASGTLASHYAPNAHAVIVPAAELLAYLERAAAEGVAVLARRPAPAGLQETPWRTMPDDPRAYAHDLYAALRDLDAHGVRRIVIEAVPNEPAWLAVRDRLTRAATKRPHG